MVGLSLRLRPMEHRVGRVRLAAVLALCSGGTALGEASPYYIGASQSFTHESNLVRLADGQPLPAGITLKSDRVSTTTVLGGIDQPFGRQRFYANASVHHNRYRKNSIYDNTGYQITTGLDWSTRERVSGSLRAMSNRKLASFNLNEPDQGSITAIVVTKRNTETRDNLSAVMRVGTVTKITFEGEVGRKQLKYSADDFKSREFNENRVELSGRYQSSGNLTLGAGLRLTDGRYPAPVDDYTGQHLNLSAAWKPTGVSTITGRMRLGNTDHTLQTRDFSGTTGSVDWTWIPTGKLQMKTQFSRNTAEDAAFIDLSDGSVGENTRVTTAISMNGRYQATSKVAVDGVVSLGRRTLSAPNDSGNRDRTRRVRLGATYAPTRSLLFSCSVSRESRNASGTGTLSYDYSANVSSCSAQFSLGH